VKSATFDGRGRLRHGLAAGQYLHPLPDPLPASSSVLDLLAARPDEEVLSRCGDGVRWKGVQLHPPLRPGPIRDFITFEGAAAWARRPPRRMTGKEA
jgi:hypothetical protein